MNGTIAAKPTGFSTFWFSAIILWLFIFAHVFDDVRHHVENLFLLFIVPFLFLIVAVSVWVGRFFWLKFPNLSPRHSQSNSSNFPVAVGLLSSLVVTALWVKSPLFTWFYDSGKIILLMVLAGVLLGIIYKIGGRFSVFASLLYGALAAITAFLVSLVAGLWFDGVQDLWKNMWIFASIGIPYAVTVALYDCYRKAQTAR